MTDTAKSGCALLTFSELDAFWTIVDTGTLEWIANLGLGTYEFATDDQDLPLKLRYLTESSKKFDTEDVFWELYHCEDCEISNAQFPFHVRISQ